ncbi:MAG: DUF3037 domain-containing protein [Microcystaceae cyanobacterium]
MVSRYSIIQYIPDPIADERINIGVLLFDDYQVKVHFLNSWKRVQNFSGDNIGFLRDFAKRMERSADEGLLFPGDQETELPKHQRLLKVAQGWMNSIQFTEPRGSLQPLEDIFEEIITKFLVEPIEPPKKPRNRQDAARITIKKVKTATLKKLGNEGKDLIKEKYAIAGQHGEYELDIAVVNSHPYLAAQGLSFEVHPPESVLNDLSWKIEEINKKNPDFPLAVMVLPPNETVNSDYKMLEKIYRERTNIYIQQGAEVLTENNFDQWILQHLPL